MSDNLTDDQIQHAKARAGEKIDFISHFLIYLLVNSALFFVDVVTGDNWWFYWPAFFWGIGLVAHFLSAFIFPGLLYSLRNKFEKDELDKVRNSN